MVVHICLCIPGVMLWHYFYNYSYMNLYAHQPYWLLKNGILDSYNSLDRDLIIDVAIMGGGISAALVAYYLRNSGLSVAVFDRRHVGMGSTAASTAFLQYEIDTPLSELCNYVGEAKAVRSYELCRKAIYDIGKICTGMDYERATPWHSLDKNRS